MYLKKNSTFQNHPHLPDQPRTSAEKERKRKERYQDECQKEISQQEFFAKALDNDTSETHVTGVYIFICAHTVWPQMLQLSLYT